MTEEFLDRRIAQLEADFASLQRMQRFMPADAGSYYHHKARQLVYGLELLRALKCTVARRSALEAIGEKDG